MTLCIFLRPEVRRRDAAHAYAAGLAATVPTALALGADALAHITLVHLDGIDDRADDLWRAASNVLDDTYEIEGPFYLCAIPFPDGSGHNFVRVEVSRSDPLQRAQQAMLQLAVDMGAAVTNLAGPAWRPHVTMAVIDELPKQLPTFPELVGQGPWTATPAMGTIGPYRHVDSLLQPQGSQ